jgi:hypothetical protein
MDLDRINRLEHHRRLSDRLEFTDAFQKHKENGERLQDLHRHLNRDRTFRITNCKGSPFFDDLMFPGVLHILRDGGCEIPWNQGWQNVEKYFKGTDGKKKAETLIKFMELID